MQISGIQAQSSGMSTVVVFILIRQMKSSLYNNPALVTMRKLGYHRNLLALSSAVGVQHTPFVDQITGLFFMALPDPCTMCQETEQRTWLPIWRGGCWVHVYLASRDRIRSRGTLDQRNKSNSKLRLTT